MLSDRFIEVPESDAIELLEYEAGSEHGVAQTAFHPWGVALMPIDERQSWRLLRRADVGQVTSDPLRGRVDVAVISRPNGPPATTITFVGLGAAAERQRARVDGLRAGALADAASIVGSLIPDAASSERSAAGALLVDGRPVKPSELGAAWTSVERAVLADPTYAASYAALVGAVGERRLLDWPRSEVSRPTGGTHGLVLRGAPGQPDRLRAACRRDRTPRTCSAQTIRSKRRCSTFRSR